MLFFSMSKAWSADCEMQTKTGEYKPRYAKLFSINYYKDFKIITSDKDRFIVSPNKVLDCSTTLPLISSDVKRLIATSTTHLSFLKTFGFEKILIGFPGTQYIFNPTLRAQPIKSIHHQLNAEELLSLRPDLIMAYSANLASEKKLLDLRKVNLPVVMNHDFEETHPLARAEWVVFNSVFIGKDLEAQKIFKEIEAGYSALKAKNDLLHKRPFILVGDIQNGKWVTCGGQSDLAILIRDAGGLLVLESRSNETQYVSLEKILSQQNIPTVWLTQNTWNDLSVIKKDSRYKKFAGTRKYNNNGQINAEGFNDFWEAGISRPDLLLRDLYAVFHPEKNLNSNLVWYKELR
jgi:iron complex transport system substrate-binding protein